MRIGITKRNPTLIFSNRFNHIRHEIDSTNKCKFLPHRKDTTFALQRPRAYGYYEINRYIL
jgi:hypothetical protein